MEQRLSKLTGARAPLLSGLLLLCGLAALPSSHAAGGDPGNEFQFTFSPHHDIHGNLSAAGELGYYWNPREDYETWTAMWEPTWIPGRDWRLSLGLRGLYTDYESGADKFELRPYAGVKYFLPNDLSWHIYNYTRLEFRDTRNLNTHEWSSYGRLRSRFALEVPLSRSITAWDPRSWYGLVDVEPFYRFDQSSLDPLLVRGGIGYLFSNRLHVELICQAQFSRPSDGSGLDHTENMFLLNFKVGLHDDVLRRLYHPGHAR